ncbi:MAG TPA: hypothetical protein VK540_06745 [Polyangiaceae bacterium]|nr:hypothetical protein [Polyangiaceae bacterium]
MKKRMLLTSLRYGISASVVALSPCAVAQTAQFSAAPLQLVTGQFITPTAPRGAVQQLLNPGLAAYPNFVAGEAVRSQLSPDGTTLAILCAGTTRSSNPTARPTRPTRHNTSSSTT